MEKLEWQGYPIVKKIGILSYPLHSTPPLGGFPSEYRYPLCDGKTRVVSLPDGKKFRRYLYSFWHNSRTWRTDGRTDTGWQQRPRLCIASRGKKLNFIEITLPVQSLHKYKYSVFWFILQKQFILVFMHYTKIMRLSYSWISCTAVSLLQWNEWYPDGVSYETHT